MGLLPVLTPGAVSYTHLDVYKRQRLSRLEQQCRENPQESIAGVRDYIISYLTGTCAYNLQSGDLPAGEDFTEYFLYERREGYCVHSVSYTHLDVYKRQYECG